jgi:hypothetical protein
MVCLHHRLKTVIKMLEALPPATQNQVIDHLREYLEDIQDEMRWDKAFESNRPQLTAAARRVKQEIAEGKAGPMDYDAL